jgi:hypothetical protein
MHLEFFQGRTSVAQVPHTADLFKTKKPGLGISRLSAAEVERVFGSSCSRVKCHK